MVHKRIAHRIRVLTCGQDCEHTLHHLHTVYVPFATKQNLSVFSQIQREIVCITYTCFFHVCGPQTSFLRFLHFFNMNWSMFVECMLKLWFVVHSPHIQGKLIYRAPSMNCPARSRRACVYRVLGDFIEK